jgi:hypothetical protein
MRILVLHTNRLISFFRKHLARESFKVAYEGVLIE